MMRWYVVVMGVVSLGLVAGCAEDVSQAPGGPGIAIEIAPLVLPGVKKACYHLEVQNDVDQTVWSEASICSDQYGGANGISYVGTCDAQDNDDSGTAMNTVTVTIENIYVDGNDGDVAVADSEWDNPCSFYADGSQVQPNGDGNGPCQLQVPCVENADQPAVFNLAIMRDANQGFFDIAVNFEDIFCSSKIDCVEGSGDAAEPIRFLHNPNTQERDDTIVFGRACTAGPGVDTQLHVAPPLITCGFEFPFSDSFSTRYLGLYFSWDPTVGDGNQLQSNLDFGLDPWLAQQPPFNGQFTFEPDLSDIISEIAWQNANYSGEEQLTGLNKIYLNQAIGFDFAALQQWWNNVTICAPAGGGDCNCDDADADGYCDCQTTITVQGLTACCDDITTDAGGDEVCNSDLYFQGFDDFPSTFDMDFEGCSLMTSFTATSSDGFPQYDSGFDTYPAATSFQVVPDDVGDPLLGSDFLVIDPLTVWSGDGLACTQHPLDGSGDTGYETAYGRASQMAESFSGFCMEADPTDDLTELVECAVEQAK